MRRDVLILTGTCAVGKTTAAWYWATQRGGASIHGDQIREWIRDNQVARQDRYQEAPIARIAISAAKEFLDLGLHVAIENVWTPAGLRMLTDALEPLGRVRSAWLRCQRSENHQRDQMRHPSEQRGARIDEVLTELEAVDWPESVVKLDTTELAPEQTIQALERLFRS